MIKLETVDLTKCYGDFMANDKINLQVQAQEIKCIVGENGAGKTTLMNMLYGIHQPTSGKIIVAGNEVVFKSPKAAMKAGIGMVHQHFKLVPSLTVYENVFLGTEILKSNKLWIDRRQEVSKVQELIDKYHFQLNPEMVVANTSVGMKQQIEILKMLYRDVDTLILDEPTSVLTPQEVDKLIINLKELRAAGKTIVVITHKLREVMALSDSVTVMRKGRLVEDVKTKETDEKRLAQAMIGREVMLTIKNTKPVSQDNPVVFRVSQLAAMNETGKKTLNNIDFEIRTGEILGIAGVEGNGQSELVKVLSGLLLPTKGQVILESENITGISVKKLREKGLGIIPEDRYAQGLCKEMSLAENAIAGVHYRSPVSSGGIIDRKASLERCRRYIEKYDIRVAQIEGAVSQLSGGNAQKLIIARELENQPKLLIASQPTRGVDIGSIEYIHGRILDYKQQGGAVLLISSELSEIISLSDRIVVMYQGTIVGQVDSAEVDGRKLGWMMTGVVTEGGQADA